MALRVSSVITTAAAFAWLGVAAAPAAVEHAGGIQYVSKRVPDFSGYDRLVAKCPSNTNVIGGGESNPGTYQQARLYHSFPVGDDRWAVDMLATNPMTVRVYAICVGISVEYRSKRFTTPNLGEQTEELEVSCTGDKQILGGGERAPRKAAENSSYPTYFDSWATYVDSFASGQGKIEVTAICGNPHTDLVYASNTIQPNSQNGLQTECPGGSHIYSGGEKNTGYWSEVGVNGGFPIATGGAAPDDAWLTYLDNNTGSALTGEVRALCGPALN